MKVRDAARALVLGCLLGIVAGCSQPATNGSDAAADDVDRLRSLPYLDFAREKGEQVHGVVVFDRQRSHPGYTLYVNRKLCSAELIDARGRIVHSWSRPPCHHWVNCEISPEGDLLLAGMDATEKDERRHRIEARFLMRLAWNGDVVWKRRMPAHHDVELTPRNQLLTLTLKVGRQPSLHPTADLRDNLLSLVSLAGEVVEELSLYDLFSSDSAPFTLQDVRVQHKHGHDEIDLFHANSVEWMRRPHLEARHPIYALGNVLVTIRHQDTIAVIDWHRRQVIWTWGQGEISGPHDATVLDDGNILLFDNGLARGWSRVIELDPITGKIVWEYRAPEPRDFFTGSRGANQRLPNGNTLITNSDSGQVFEVTPEGEIVWELFNPNLNEEGHRATIVRAKRYESSFIERFLMN